MDLAAFLLILLKYYGLYWLFDKEVNYEFPVRQLEMTLGVWGAHLLVYLGVAAIDKDVWSVFTTFITMYLTAAILEAGLLVYYKHTYKKLDKEQYKYHRHYGVGRTPMLGTKSVTFFNTFYPLILLLVYVIQK